MGQDKDARWWQTLPGVLTGIAALITAIGGIVAIVLQAPRPPTAVPTKSTTGRIATPADGATARQPSPAAATDSRAAQQNPPDAGAPQTLQVGHWLIKLLSARAEPYPGSDASPKALLHLSLRVTDTAGISDYVDRQTLRLIADGAELLPENFVDVAVYEHQAAEIEAVYRIPADVAKLQLLLGHPGDSVGRMPVTLNVHEVERKP